MASYQFRGNSPYDPDYTGTGGQPTGFDTYAALYNMYRCYGSKISVTFMGIASLGAAANVNVALEARPTNTLPADMTDAIGNPYVKYRTVNYNTNSPTTLKMFMSTAKIDGLPKVAVKTADDYTAAVNTNPTAQWYWNVLMQPIVAATSTNVYAIVRITYYCEFYGRQLISDV